MHRRVPGLLPEHLYVQYLRSLFCVAHVEAGSLALVRHFPALDDLPLVRCYPAEVNQLLMNVVVNALDAVGDSGTIAVRATADDECVQVVVEDDGDGIPAADLSNIFNPGFTTKGVSFGAGLGLAIAYQVAELHGGSISVESSPGAGARFTTRLPMIAPTSERRSNT